MAACKCPRLKITISCNFLNLHKHVLDPTVIRPLDLVPKGQFSVLNDLYFKTTCNIRPHFLGLVGGLKIEGPLYCALFFPDSFAYPCFLCLC